MPRSAESDCSPRSFAGAGLVPLPLRAAARPGYLSAVTGVAPVRARATPSWRRVLAPRPALHRQLLGDLHPARAHRDRRSARRLRRTRTRSRRSPGVLIIVDGRALRRRSVRRPAQPRVARRRADGAGRHAAARSSPAPPSRSPGRRASGPTLARSSPSPRITELGRARAACCSPSTRSGSAIPFLLTAIAFSRMTTAFDFVKRHYARDRRRRRRDPDRDGRPGPHRRVLPAEHRGPEADSTSSGSTSSARSERRLSAGTAPTSTGGADRLDLLDLRALAGRASRRSGSGRCRSRGRGRPAGRGSPPSRGARPRTGSSAPRPPGTGSRRCAGRSPSRSPRGSCASGSPSSTVAVVRRLRTSGCAQRTRVR